MRRVTGIAKWMLRGIWGLTLFFLGLAVATIAPGDSSLYPPGPGADGAVRVVVVDHGYHTGLVLPQGAVRAAAAEIRTDAPGLAARLDWLTAIHPRAEWLEIGWGDADFYQGTPGIADIDPAVALRAVFLPTPSAVQVVPGWGLPELAFPHSGTEVLVLSGEGFRRLALRLAETLEPVGPDGGPEMLGLSLYGSGAFYPAVPPYHALRTCNHWTSSLLRAAGVPSSWFLSTTSHGLMAELRLRAG